MQIPGISRNRYATRLLATILGLVVILAVASPAEACPWHGRACRCDRAIRGGFYPAAFNPNYPGFMPPPRSDQFRPSRGFGSVWTPTSGVGFGYYNDGRRTPSMPFGY